MKYLTLLLTLILSTNTLALELDYSVGFGIAAGGDDLAETDGPDVTAGSGLFFVPKVKLKLSENDQINLGLSHRIDAADADNGDVFVNTFWLEAVYEKNSRWIFGYAGLTYHFNTEYELNLDGQEDTSVDFENAAGFLIGGGVRFSQLIRAGIRYEFVDYKLENDILLQNSETGATKSKFSGDSYGVFMEFVF